MYGHHNASDFTIAANFGMKSRQYAPDLFTDRALKFVEQNRQNPFFLYLPTFAPHGASNLDQSGIRPPKQYTAFAQLTGLPPTPPAAMKDRKAAPAKRSR